MVEALFTLINVLPVPVWLSMLLFPRRRFTERLVMAYWPLMVVAGVYTLLLVAAVLSGGIGVDLSFHTLREAMTLDVVFLAIWAHIVAFNLFVGVWIFRDAKYWGIRPPLYLVLTFFFGPVGLLAYLWTRERRAKTDPVRSLN